MRELLAVLVRYLVEDPAAVEVREIEGQGSVTYELSVAPGDVGRVIGRQGKVIRALRQVMRATASGASKRIEVELAQRDSPARNAE
jgi:hypothetical protein